MDAGVVDDVRLFDERRTLATSFGAAGPGFLGRALVSFLRTVVGRRLLRPALRRIFCLEGLSVVVPRLLGVFWIVSAAVRGAGEGERRGCSWTLSGEAADGAADSALRVT